MPPRPRRDPEQVRSAVTAVSAGSSTPVELALAVRALAQLLAERAPGRHVELRIPPYVAVQCVDGPRHTRGTPPNTVETDPLTFVALCTGRLTWADAVVDGRVRASGSRADLSPWLPLTGEFVC